MGRPRTYDIDALAGQLYDELARGAAELKPCPHDILGLTTYEIAVKLDVPVHVVRRIIRKQRLIFAGDEINIPIHVCGTDHIYHLSGQIEGGQEWMARRIKNEIAQEQVNVAWWQSMVNASQHDLVRSKFAGMVLKDHERLLEDLKGLV